MMRKRDSGVQTASDQVTVNECYTGTMKMRNSYETKIRKESQWSTN